LVQKDALFKSPTGRMSGRKGEMMYLSQQKVMKFTTVLATNQKINKYFYVNKTVT